MVVPGLRVQPVRASTVLKKRIGVPSAKAGQVTLAPEILEPITSTTLRPLLPVNVVASSNLATWLADKIKGASWLLFILLAAKFTTMPFSRKYIPKPPLCEMVVLLTETRAYSNSARAALRPSRIVWLPPCRISVWVKLLALLLE